MTPTELETWALEVFWPQYKQLCKTPHVTKWTGGQRGEAVNAITKLKPSEELRQVIVAAIQEQIIHRRKLYAQCGSAQRYEEYIKYNKFYTNRDGKTWVNNKGWTDEIPTLTDHEDRAAVNVDSEKCSMCNNPVHGPKFDRCTFHLGFDQEGKLHHAFALEMRMDFKRNSEEYNRITKLSKEDPAAARKALLAMMRKKLVKINITPISTSTINQEPPDASLRDMQP